MSETNLSPTYSPFRGVVHHRRDAVAYPNIQGDYDDPAMMASRTAAILALTGEPEGEINDRAYFRPFVPAGGSTAQPPSGSPAPAPAASKQPEPSKRNPTAADYKNVDEEEEEQEFSNSQDFKMQDDTEDDGDEFHDSISEAPDTKLKPSPKKRRVDEEGAAVDDTANKPTKMHYIQTVVAMPPSATVFDMLDFFNDFEPGFGTDYDDQVQPCKFFHFRHGFSVLVGCPVDQTDAFKTWVMKNKLFGKFKCEIRELKCFSDVTVIRKNYHDEKLVRDYLCQYLKRALHPCLDVELRDLIAQYKTGSEVMAYFADQLEKYGNFVDNHPAKDKPIPLPDYEVIESRGFWKRHYELWYDGNLKSF